MKRPVIFTVVAGIWLAIHNVTMAIDSECVPKDQKVNLEDNTIASLRDKLLKQMSGRKLQRDDVICIFGKPDNIYNNKQTLPKFAGKLNDREHLIIYGNPIATPAASNALHFFENADGKIRLFRHFLPKKNKLFEFDFDLKVENIYKKYLR